MPTAYLHDLEEFEASASDFSRARIGNWLPALGIACNRGVAGTISSKYCMASERLETPDTQKEFYKAFKKYMPHNLN